MRFQFILSKPLDINVAELASYLKEFRHREPFVSTFGEKVTSEYIIDDHNDEFSYVFCFDGRKENGFTTLTTDYTPEMLSNIFKKLSPELSSKLKRAFLNSSLLIIEKYVLNKPTLEQYKKVCFLPDEESKMMDVSVESESNVANFIAGPLEKTLATDVLEDMLEDFSHLEKNYFFSLNEDGLNICFQHILTGKIKEYPINILLANANLSHLQINHNFLNLYLKKLDLSFTKKLNVFSQDEFEQLYDSRKKRDIFRKVMIEEKLTAAHRLAIFNYTQSALDFQFNAFLKGDTSFLCEISKKMGEKSDSFQFLSFYTVSTLIILGNALSLFEIEHDWLHQMKSEATFRIGVNNDKNKFNNNIIEGMKAAAEQNAKTFLVKEPAFISTSLKKLSLSKKYDPIAYDTKENIFLITFEDEYEKLIDSLSLYPLEKELILPPTDIEYTILQTVGPFTFLLAKTVSPLNSVEKDTHMLQMALRYVGKMVSQEFKKSKPGDTDHHLVFYKNKPPIQKPNHALAHAARQSKNIIDAFELILKSSRGNTLNACQFLQKRRLLLDLVQVAASFLSVGRQNEKSGDEDPEEYIRSRLAARQAFEDYIQDTYPKLLAKDEDFLEVYKASAEAIQHLGSIPYMQQLGKDQSLRKLIFHLLTTAHLLETPRCIPLEICKGILESRLLLSVGGILKHNKTVDSDLEKLWEKSLDRIKKTGDRIIHSKNYSYPFYEVSTSPLFCEKLLALQEPKKNITILPPSEELSSKKIEERSEEAAFNFLSYLFQKSTDSDRQIRYFIEPQITVLLDLAIRFLEKNEKICDVNESKFIIAIQKEAIKKIEWVMAESPSASDIDCKTTDEFFEKRKIELFLEEEKVQYRFYSKLQNKIITGFFYKKFIGQKNYFELQEHDFGQLDPDALSHSLKNAIIINIHAQQQSVIITKMQEDFFKTLLKWVSFGNFISFKSGLNSSVVFFINYLNSVLNETYSSESIINKIILLRYITSRNCKKEILFDKGINFYYLHELLETLSETFQISLMVPDKSSKLFIHDMVEEKMKQGRDSHSILAYQADVSYQANGDWYACGFDSKGKFLKTKISDHIDEYFVIPTSKQSFFSFNKFLATAYQDPKAQYYLAMCYSEGIGVEKSAIHAHQWSVKAIENNTFVSPSLDFHEKSPVKAGFFKKVTPNENEIEEKNTLFKKLNF